ncbi:unnamed protein product [Ectocarpus sp. CCAP 1310/34]|nr:unnamed protein product [Ectocarpus sp. CCAP 1310/34]
MITGGKFEDGSGRGFVPQQTTGDGACFFHGIANAAFGMKCKARRGVLAYALPIRLACLKTALANMEAMLSMDGWGWFYRSLQPYDMLVMNRALAIDLDVPADGLLPIETARVMYLFGVLESAGELMYTQQFCYPLVAETLQLNLRVFHPVLSVNRLAHNSWCHHLFTPTIASRRARSATPTVYLAMSRSGGKPVKNIQEYERAHRVPMSPDKNGQPRPGYRHDFPDCQHFVYLLPRADAEEMQRREQAELAKKALAEKDAAARKAAARKAAALEEQKAALEARRPEERKPRVVSA